MNLVYSNNQIQHHWKQKLDNMDALTEISQLYDNVRPRAGGIIDPYLGRTDISCTGCCARKAMKLYNESCSNNNEDREIKKKRCNYRKSLN